MFADFSSVENLSASIRKDFLSFGESKLKELREGVNIPKVLYHYTDSSGFKGVVEESSLRATHIGYLNDGNEYVKAVSVLLNALDKTLGENKHPKSCDNMLIELWERLRATTPKDFPPMFVICFTRLRNSLNQWRAYSRGDGGFSIGFDGPIVSQYADKTMRLADLVPVIYSDERLKKLINDYIGWFIATYPKHLAARGDIREADFQTNWVNGAASVTGLLATMFKDEEFREEEEFRITVLGQLTDVKFNPKPSMLSPYLNCPIRIPPKNLLPIIEVWAGPGRYTPLNAVSARAMLMQNKYDMGKIEIMQSNIRYRVG